MAKEKPVLRYRDAGVNIDAADEAVRGIKDLVKKTYDDHVLCDIGTFGAMYQLDVAGIEDPVLVSSVDGVGTKLKLAFMTGKHDTIGIDLVSHCVNDILVQGAKPLFFLDYVAFGKLRPQVMVEVIRGISYGCRYAGCALIGGETAEMPGMYLDNEYDVAGTIVGMVDRKKIIDGSTIEEGDVVIGLHSSGLHTNGYSLARKICFEVAGLSHTDYMPGTGRSVGDMLLEPHRSYSKVIQILMKIVTVKGMAHITGGGITDNLPRVLPAGLSAEIQLKTWEAPPIFKFLRDAGNVPEDDMLRTFNMGMGFLVIVSADQRDKALDALMQACEAPQVIGRIIKGERKVNYVGSTRYAASD
ncbi:MAG: phosphoribosylformylglycinamidine cyclo-ligase [Candidatus Hydrogenedentes bacterium]|nr:phosphoribosylformylglycinamidine cyclo-ligase [Candidatus Hydrogenedentota bacterium]